MLLSVDFCVGVYEIIQRLTLLRWIQFQIPTNRELNAVGIMSAKETRQDQWQAQIQARIQLKADVYVYSGGLTAQQIRDALLIPSEDIAGTVEMLRQKYGRDARIGILPEGPQTIPYLVPTPVLAE